MRLFGGLAEQYREFAEDATDSACFAAWSAAVADDPEVLTWVADLPRVKQQPNLVFAAARWHGVPAPGPYAGLREALLADDGAIRATILERATQTNEVGRLATLLPVFALVPGPVALLEVGASAGLNLFPDAYEYAWPPAGGLRGSGGPTLTAQVSGAVPLPTSYPEVAWRGGLDQHPLDVRDDDEMAWLETLVWPEDDARRTRLRTAVEVARRDPPRLVEADAVDGLPALVEEASAHGTVLVFHSAVVAYFPDELRVAFADLARSLVADRPGRAHWVSNEAMGVVPGLEAPGRRPGHFLTALDGVPLAWSAGHGQSLTWL